MLTRLALVAQDLLGLQARLVAGAAPDPALHARLDGIMDLSLTHLNTLAELRALDLLLDATKATESEDAARYTASRLDEAAYLAQTLHRELLAALEQRY